MSKEAHFSALLTGVFEDPEQVHQWAKLFEEAHHVHHCHPESWKREGDFTNAVALCSRL